MIVRAAEVMRIDDPSGKIHHAEISIGGSRSGRHTAVSRPGTPGTTPTITSL